MANGHAASANLDVHQGSLGGPVRYVPQFLIVFVLYLIGVALIKDPRGTLFHLGPYALSWVEVLLVVATAISLVEQMKVSHPGIDNTIESLGMIGMGVAQLICFVLGAAKIAFFGIFNTTEFLLLTLISLTAAVIAVLINARTLRRTIGVGDS